MRFVGQGAETNIPLLERDFTKMTKERVRQGFDGVYEKLYGRTYPDSEVEFINFKVRASLPERLLQLPKLERSEVVSGQGRQGAAEGLLP